MRTSEAPAAAAVSPETERPDRRGVAVLAAAHAVNDSYAYVLQALLPVLMPALGVSLGLAGLLIAGYQLTSSLIQPFLGHLADRTAVRWLAWAGVATSGLAAAALGVAPSALALFGLVLLAGLGTSAFHPAAAAMVSGSAVRYRGRIMSLYITAGNVGLGLGPLAVAPILAGPGPAGSLLLAPPALVLAALVFLWAPQPRPHGARSGSLWSVLARHRRLVSRLVAIVVLRSSAFAGLAAFLPLLLAERGLSPSTGSLALALFLGAGALGGLAGGFLADRWGRDRLIQASLVLSVPSALLVHVGGEVLLWPALLLTGLFLNGSFVVLTVRAQESMPESIAMISGLMLGLTIGIGGAAAAGLAQVAEQIGLGTTLVLAAFLPLPAAALAFTLGREGPDVAASPGDGT